MDFYNLKPGSRFKAQILDMRPGKITIKLQGGGTLTARTKVMPNAYIGDTTVFGVKSNNFKGQIFLEVLDISPDAMQESQESNGEGTASAATAEAKQEFLAKEGMTGNNAEKNLENLDKVLDPKFHLRFALKKLVDKILSLPPSHAKNLMIETMLGEGFVIQQTQSSGSIGNGADLRDLLYQALVFRFKPGAPASSLRDYFGNLRKKIDTMLEISSAEAAIQIAEEVRGIKESLDFTARLKNEYYQLPGEPPGELFIYPDGAAVIAVDAPNLGRIEVSATDENGITKLEIRAASKKILGFLGQNIARLYKMLEQSGIDTKAFKISFKAGTERTTVLSKSPQQPSGYTVVKHQAFDMRV